MSAPEQPSAPAAAELLVTTPREGLWRLEGPHAREVARVLLGRRLRGVTLTEVIGGAGALLVALGWIMSVFPGGPTTLREFTVIGGAMWIAGRVVEAIRYAALCRELRLSPVEMKLLDDALDKALPDYQPPGAHFVGGQLKLIPDRLDAERVSAAVEDARRAVDAL